MGAGALVMLAFPAHADAYVGPGAGIAVATTALVFIVSVILALVGLLLWPAHAVYRAVTKRRAPKPAKVDRAVIIGLDGLDPKLTRKLLDAGELPNLQRIAAKGTFRELGTTFPAMSPVAWSTFATGVNPGKHGIFDFLTRDKRTYLPDLSSAEVGAPTRHLRIGKRQIPIGKPNIRLLRKSKPFWEIMGEYRIPCSVLRVPITFPATRVEGGTMLSAMCVPDLQGTQGSFTQFTTDSAKATLTGGQHILIRVEDDTFHAALVGPPNPLRTDAPSLELPFRVRLDRAAQCGELRIGGRTVELPVGEYTDWIEVAFPMGMGTKLRGICRFRLLELGDHVRLYVTPINIDPAKPIMPISYPHYFSVFLAKMCGRFATLGLAEDTWALNEGVLDENAFLEQAWSNHQEREAQFFEMLRRTKRGVLTCVFDGTDRIQHMFMRYMDDGHPALTEEDRNNEYRDVIPDTYRRMDEMIGRVLAEVDIDDPRNLVVVLSDHGFQTFRRGVNINTWLHRNGYLVLKEGCDESREWFQDVDWSKTRAFGLGLGGVWLNLKGRELQGIVDPADANELSDQIARELTGLVDDDLDAVAVEAAYSSHTLFHGPYADDAPDVVVGYAAGWRASWDGVRGIINDILFDDNKKAWSGDHCIDPKLVPGVLFANQALGADLDQLNIVDMAPTLLAEFGIPAPKHMDGRSLAA